MKYQEAISAIKSNYPDSRYSILREALDVAIEKMEDGVVEALQGHDTEFLQRKATQLKQSDGEGWAIGEMVERVIKQYGQNGTVQINQ